ncbi:MAG: CvpA family protein [Flavobacteriales bacterium]|nr:CvpA family protein [Flavobacteriales bacterium]
MNWLDWSIIALVAFSGIKGFMRGSIVELASLVALIAAIWAGIHLSERVAEATGLGTDNAAIAFVVTFLIVLLGVHLLARFLTTVVDIAQLSLPNKLAGVVFGLLRALFAISVALNLVVGYSEGELPPAEVRDASVLYAPVRASAPLVVPALEGTKWVKRAMEGIKEVIAE